MATSNPFDLLGDDDNGDVSQLVFVHQEKPTVKKASQPAQTAPAKLPSKPLPPALAVRESRNGVGRGGRGGRGGDRNQDVGYSNRGRGSYNGDRFNRNGYNNDNDSNGYLGGGYGGGFNQGGEDGSARQENGEFGRSSERGRGYGRGRGRGGRGGYGNDAGDESQRPRRQYERRSGSGRGFEVKREGAGRGNWGTPTDQGFTEEPEELSRAEEEKTVTPEKQEEQKPSEESNQEIPAPESEEKKEEEEDKEMTLDEYEKVLEEKRKALMAMKLEERRVDAKEFESMQQLSVKKNSDDVFIKLGSEKEAARRRDAEKEERIRKSISINEFLKPAEGENYYSSGGRGRGRGRGRGDRGGFLRGGYDGGNAGQSKPRIEDPGQFPSLAGK